jgi:glycosyltransferase involved in cell wall biosynthesis
MSENNSIAPLVSVVMITYNHEAYIAEAIEGVLMQEVDFPVEFIIADDSSPDRTAEIIKKYIKNHPNGHWIVYTRHETNKGMMPNFIWALQQAKGKYIALCEGDDYWTDPLKLQKQVDFLEANQAYSGCAHEVEIKYEDPSNRPILFTSQDIETIAEASHYFYPTCSVVFKSSVLGEREMDLFKIGFVGGDKALLYMMFKHGKLKCLSEKMGVYRKNKGGISYTMTVNKEMLRKEIVLYQRMKEYFDNRFNPHFNQLSLQAQVRLNNLFLREKKIVSFIFELLKGIKYVRNVNNLKLLIKDSFHKQS